MPEDDMDAWLNSEPEVDMDAWLNLSDITTPQVGGFRGGEVNVKTLNLGINQRRQFNGIYYHVQQLIFYGHA